MIFRLVTVRAGGRCFIAVSPSFLACSQRRLSAVVSVCQPRDSHSLRLIIGAFSTVFMRVATILLLHDASWRFRPPRSCPGGLCSKHPATHAQSPKSCFQALQAEPSLIQFSGKEERKVHYKYFTCCPDLLLLATFAGI